MNTNANNTTVTIQDPGAKATNAQLRVIGHAVKENQLERFDENAWKNMTKGQAAEIITKLYADHGELPASQAQKTKLGDLIRRGFLKGLKRETYQNLTSSQAKRMIYKGLQNETANRTVE
jgi:SOS response regulatory protein OraA/RecX